MGNNNDGETQCLVILAGGQSSRMGQEKAILKLGDSRLVDIAIKRFEPQTDKVYLSSSTDLGTRLDFIPDNPEFPAGPVGAIYSIAAVLPNIRPRAAGFVTVPVDAPFAPDDLITRLQNSSQCTVASDSDRLHPVFAYWRCDIVNAVRKAHDLGGTAPSLHWLARQCNSMVVQWPDTGAFSNINTPDDLIRAEKQTKKADAN